MSAIVPPKKITRSKKAAPIEQIEPINAVEPIEQISAVEPEENSLDMGAYTKLSFSETLKSALENVAAIRAQIKGLENTIRNVKFLHREEIKNNKQTKKRKRQATDASSVPHGFVKPALISNELADFLKVPHGSELARPQVTRKISEYIKEHNCYGEKMDKTGEMKLNKTIIVPDHKLKKLLGNAVFEYSKKNPELGLGYNYFNLQSYLKKQNHFIKPAVVA